MRYYLSFLFSCFLWYSCGYALVLPSPGSIGTISSFDFGSTRVQNCDEYDRQGDEILVDPSCILQGEIPNLNIHDRVDAVWGSLLEVGTGYVTSEPFMIYTSENLVLDPKKSLYPLSEKIKNSLISAEIVNKKVRLPISFFGKRVYDSLAFFVSDKDISQLKPCTKTNYLLAFDNLDGKSISPGGYFNFNGYLAGLRGYCKGNGGLDLKFYGGVCGASSQLFRASLTSPMMNIASRRAHSDWYSAYYGDRIEGDDAAVYEMSKQFIIHNLSNYEVIIKTFKSLNKTYLVFVIDAKAVKNQWVEIQKTYPNPMGVHIIKQVYKKIKSEKKSQLLPRHISSFISPWSKNLKSEEKNESVFSQFFDSQYTKVNDSLR